MASSLERLARWVWHLVPISVRRRLGEGGGRRLMRFVPAALLAAGATQLTYFVCFDVAGLGGLKSGAAGWLAGAAVSYVVSRWAWERRGRPDVLREVLPFWGISLCVGAVLSGAGKLAGYEAAQLRLAGLDEVAFAQGLYLAANGVTFAARFVIFQKFVFADRSRGAVTGRSAVDRVPGRSWSAQARRRLAALAGRVRDGEPLVGELARFGVVGTAVLMIADAGADVLHFRAGAGPLASAVAAGVVAVVVSFVGNRWWTFRHRQHHGVVREGVLFLALSGAGLVIQFACLAVIGHVPGLHGTLAALVAGVMLAACFRFWSYRTWVWRAWPPAPPAATQPRAQAVPS